MRSPRTRFARPLKGALSAAWQRQYRGSRSVKSFDWRRDLSRMNGEASA